MAKDFWLRTAYIADHTMNHVTLTLRKDEVEEHRLEAPGLETQDAPAHGAVQNERLRSGIV